ncbi:MAG: DNA mismatch repair protein MutT [Gammaproteobacteria bacterium HGW-Gammaproteobacteria-10]|nr:MAG: DNA mismatch repair protein MutT [Gammaproteobacteria bacterium HGW-Gammaproteobacteria-10]
MQSVLEVAVGAVVDRNGKVLIAKRPDDKHQGGLWEFPGGKIEPGETQRRALDRELHEELAIDVKTATPLITIHHDYPDLSVRLKVWRIDRFEGDPHGREGQAVEWVAPTDLQNYSFPAANRPIVTALRLPPFYAILDDSTPSALCSNLNKILANGVTLIQLRLKTLTTGEAAEFIARSIPLCRRHGASLLLNSAVSGVEASAVDGLHLTGRDLMAFGERPDCQGWLAASCHNEAELRHAESIGVDFAVLAPVLPTATHPGADILGWQGFKKLAETANIPVFGLGGLSAGDLARVREAGGQGVAGIRAFIGAE